MAINFDNYLTIEQKQNLLTQRIDQFVGEAYQHELNRQIAERVGDADAVATATSSLDILESAIEVHQVELDGLS